jgi:hypothetical protein
MIDDTSVINPIMPLIEGRQTEMPFTTLHSFIAQAEQTDADLNITKNKITLT